MDFFTPFEKYILSTLVLNTWGVLTVIKKTLIFLIPFHLFDLDGTKTDYKTTVVGQILN